MSTARRLAIALAATAAVAAGLLPDGDAPVLAKGAKLRRGQSIEVIELTGRDVPPPSACGCDLEPGDGLSGVKGAHLANVRVRAVRHGKTVALSDPARSMILDTAALQFAWPKDTPAFKPGTHLLVYALFETD